MKEIFADLYNKVVDFFTKTEEKEESKDVARNRLKLVLMQDRTNLNPRLLERLRGEMIDLLSKYVVMDKELLELNFTPEDDQLALMLSIPVVRAKDENEIEEAIKAEEAEKERIAKLVEEAEEADDEDEENQNSEDDDAEDEGEEVEFEDEIDEEFEVEGDKQADGENNEASSETETPKKKKKKKNKNKKHENSSEVNDDQEKVNSEVLEEKDEQEVKESQEEQ